MAIVDLTQRKNELQEIVAENKCLKEFIDDSFGKGGAYEYSDLMEDQVNNWVREYPREVSELYDWLEDHPDEKVSTNDHAAIREAMDEDIAIDIIGNRDVLAELAVCDYLIDAGYSEVSDLTFDTLCKYANGDMGDFEISRDALDEKVAELDELEWSREDETINLGFVKESAYRVIEHDMKEDYDNYNGYENRPEFISEFMNRMANKKEISDMDMDLNSEIDDYVSDLQNMHSDDYLGEWVGQNVYEATAYMGMAIQDMQGEVGCDDECQSVGLNAIRRGYGKMVECNLTYDKDKLCSYFAADKLLDMGIDTISRCEFDRAKEAVEVGDHIDVDTDHKRNLDREYGE